MPKPAQANWDDLKFVLAVADTGSVSAAARALEVNHATVLRRVAAFETRHGLHVFERTPQGYQLSADRRALIEAMREAGTALAQVERLIESERPRIGESLRVTSTESFCYSLLPDMVGDLAETVGAPIEILIGNRHLDLARLQADITIRPAMELPGDLAGDRAGEFRFGVYEAESGGSPGWLGLSGPLARSAAAEWLRCQMGGGDCRFSADSFLMLASLAALGRGRVLLPVFLGDTWPGLTRVEIPNGIGPVPIWVASHVDLARSGRLARARTYLLRAFESVADRLAG